MLTNIITQKRLWYLHRALDLNAIFCITDIKVERENRYYYENERKKLQIIMYIY